MPSSDCAEHVSGTFEGGSLTKGLTTFAAFLCVGSIATGTVSVTVYQADGNTPFDWADPNVPSVFRDIMVGTRLTIIVGSDSSEILWSGRLRIDQTDAYYGELSGRDYNDVTRDWEGSHLEAAGIMARVERRANSEETYFRLLADPTSVPGDWFVIDYNAVNVGLCTVGLYASDIEMCVGCDPTVDPPAPGAERLVQELVFSHVPTRDFRGDTKVDFSDYAVLAAFHGTTNCADLNQCEGTDLDADGDVDRNDLMLFADYWLEKTQ